MASIHVVLKATFALFPFRLTYDRSTLFPLCSKLGRKAPDCQFSVRRARMYRQQQEKIWNMRSMEVLNTCESFRADSHFMQCSSILCERIMFLATQGHVLDASHVRSTSQCLRTQTSAHAKHSQERRRHACCEHFTYQSRCYIDPSISHGMFTNAKVDGYKCFWGVMYTL